MNIAELSIKRPIFITCLVALILVLGYMSLKRLPVDQFPDVTFPVVMVMTPYPGAGPQEVETLVSKVIEEEIATVPGIKTVRSTSAEGLSTVIAEFTLETDVKYAEQQIRDRVGGAKRELPEDIKEPTIRRIDPADQPIMIVALKAEGKSPGEIFDLANNFIKPKLEQIYQVGLVEVIGGRKREIHVELDRRKLASYEISATQVSTRIASAGQNIPAGKVNEDKLETVFRTLGEFKTVADVGSVIVSFFGNDVPVTVNDLGKVVDTVSDETSRAYVNGERAVFMMLFKQSKANTIAVAKAIRERTAKLNEDFKSTGVNIELTVVRDASKMIAANVFDVQESILIGVALTIIVVFFFLGSLRSTIITGLALPTSLIGAFFLMSMAGFSINVMSLLALSLAVGLLIDDAIVVRENIFRHAEMGKSPREASIVGTNEVLLAVIATTLTVIAVFGPIGFLKGVVGQFFKEFGLTVCFAMAISLFDAVTMAPMMSAYFGGASAHANKASSGLIARMVGAFDRLQSKLEDKYEATIRWTLENPIKVIVGAIGIFVLSLVTAGFVPKTFLPPQDMGEFGVALDMPPGTNLETMAETAAKVDEVIRSNKEVAIATMVVGSRSQVNQANFYITMVPRRERSLNTSEFKALLREKLKPFAYANPVVKDIDMVAGGQRPFNLNISGANLEELQAITEKAYAKLKVHPALLDPDISYRPGKPEFQVIPDKVRAERLGVSVSTIGMELRTQVEGTIPAVYREKGEEYDIRVRLQEDQRNLRAGFNDTLVPNVNFSMVRLKDVATPFETRGPATINRQDRGRYFQISADIAPNSVGMGGAIKDIDKMFKEEIPLPPGVTYSFVGQAENFKELISSMLVAAALGILFIYLVLASLYESFITPFAIMLVLPLAACGAFFALFVTRTSLDLFSMIGCIMLLGVATKNSILLVDYTNQLVQGGTDIKTALLKAGRVRLRPILMTTVALIAGMLPIAIGLNEASKQRTSMGIAVIGGLISSTLLTLVVVPATYSYIERLRAAVGRYSKRLMAQTADN